MHTQFIEIQTDHQTFLINVDDVSSVEQNSNAIVISMRTHDASGVRTRFVIQKDANKIYEQFKQFAEVGV